MLLSGLLWRGAPHALIEHVRDGTLSLICSPALLVEFADVIGRPKFGAILARSGVVTERLLGELRRLAEIVDPPPLARAVSRDPDDDIVLALAAAARADLIITGDRDLLALGSHSDIPILGVSAALQRIGS
ncbi:MAG: putative toxin-antitoxin system toxin component, PIN family [Proteobacteria bacterium]|nr:putative toxin-antitoxin system toxin component, PIN family [Pseudomonadota bacterium]